MDCGGNTAIIRRLEDAMNRRQKFEYSVLSMIIMGQFLRETFTVVRRVNRNLLTYLVLCRNSIEVVIILHSLLSSLNILLSYVVGNFDI